jgi:hypothetical protein
MNEETQTIVNDGWEKINPMETPVWKPMVAGNYITGVLIDKRSEVGVNKANLYTLETELGFKTYIWGKTILDELLLEAKIGEEIKIIFQGKKGKAFRYDIYRKVEALTKKEE